MASSSISGEQNTIDSLGSRLDASPTAYAPDTNPSKSDVSIDSSLQKANQSIDDLKSTALRNEWYGEKLCEEKILETRNEFEKEIDEFTKHEHVFDSDGGSCRVCGQTVIDLLDWKDEKPGYPSRRNAELP